MQREPWLQRDRVMISVLKSIGIQQGRDFAPDDALASTLTEAAAQAHDWLTATTRISLQRRRRFEVLFRLHGA